MVPTTSATSNTNARQLPQETSNRRDTQGSPVCYLLTDHRLPLASCCIPLVTRVWLIKCEAFDLSTTAVVDVKDPSAGPLVCDLISHEITPKWPRWGSAKGPSASKKPPF